MKRAKFSILTPATALFPLLVASPAWSQANSPPDATTPPAEPPVLRDAADDEPPVLRDDVTSEPRVEGDDPSATPEEGLDPNAPGTRTPQEDPVAQPAPVEPDTAPPSVAPSVIAESEAPSAAPISSQTTPDDALEEEFEEFVVAGSKISRSAGSAHVIGQRQLERFEYDDAAAIVQQVPGVYVRQEDGLGLRPNIGIRGVNPDRSKKLTLMEDGVLFGPAPYSAPAAYYFPLMTRLTQVRIIKGPGAVAYGPQTVGGAIDLVTRGIEAGTHGGLDLGYGMYNYNKAHGYFSHNTEQVGFLIEGTRIGTTGFKDLPSGADTGFTRNEWMLKASYLLDPKSAHSNSFELKLGYSDEASNETYLGLTDEDFRITPYRRYAASALDRFDNHRTSLVLSHTYEAPGPEQLKVRTSVYRHDQSRSWRKLNSFRGASVSTVLSQPDDPAYQSYYDVLRGEADSAAPGEVLLIGPNQRTFVSQGIQSKATISPKTGPLLHNIEGGVRLHNDSIQRRHSQDAFVMVDGQLYPDGTTPTAVTTANFEETSALALHALDAISYGPVTLTPGVRVEYIHATSENQRTGERRATDLAVALPGIGAFVSATSELGFLAGAHRGFSPPAPASGAEPESSINYELGSRYQKGTLRGELIGFYNDYSNLTDTCTLASGCVDENLDTQYSAGAARIFGLEAFFAWEPQAGNLRFPMTASYTFTRGEFLSSFDSLDPIYGNVTAGDQIPYLPEHQANLTWAIEGPLAGAHIASTYVSAMREEAGNEPFDDAMVTDRQVWVDFGAHLRPLPWLEIYAQLRNVFDAANIVARRPYGARPNAPRWLQVGVKAHF